MIFETLSLNDFGVFRGYQQFDLAPRIKYHSRRPIILFGGLNGSGKTSILTAIRLALHGRQSLGFGTSQKKYEALLARFFHRDSSSPRGVNQMSVRLDFTYSSLGGTTQYTVERSWHQNKRGISEQFSVLADGKPVESSDPEQAQVFLTQLVPVGVADLFFFDGEKIAELASEDGGTMLSESIERLLGLDVVSKLRSDLDVYERRHGRRNTLPIEEPSSGCDSIFAEIERSKSEVDAKYQKIRQEVEPAISDVRIDLDRLEGRLAERGGSWAVSRDAFREKLDELIDRKDDLESRAREMATDILPLALASKIGGDLVNQLESERARSQCLDVGRILADKRSVLKKVLSKAALNIDVDDVIQAVANAVEADCNTQPAPIHDLGESDRNRLINFFSLSLPTAKDMAKTLRKALIAVDDELAFVSARIAAAPSEEQLKDDFEMVKKANQALGDLLAQKRLLLEEVRSLLWRQIELVRKLKRDYLSSVDNNSQKEIGNRVAAIKGVLNVFSERLVARKTTLLAEQFMQSFRKLIRKGLLVSSVAVDPKSLAIKLIDANGVEIQKSHLSAGERQLFAIAMLDALAKTSGRSIPIIIDTPLGRLDSRHRSNLIKHYLPHASHQVVVLSTDTEVDERFFRDLGPAVSHAYYLDFNEVSRSTTAREGYFWRSKAEGTQNAA